MIHFLNKQTNKSNTNQTQIQMKHIQMSPYSGDPRAPQQTPDPTPRYKGLQ